MPRSLKTALPLTMLLCASITGVHAYEQNGYVIFEFVEKVTSETTQANLLPIESKIFDSTGKDSKADSSITLKSSEFLMDITPTQPQSSTFSDTTVVPNTIVETTPEPTSSFEIESISVFGDPKKSAFGE